MNEKRLSKLISYWLRHAPADGGLTLDKNGWTSTNHLLAGLNGKGFSLTAQGLKNITGHFDKVRWEFDESGENIRATHGHSVGVQPDESKRADPPRFLYHGAPISALESIFHEGLSPMSRQAVHLAGSAEAALEVGRRHGKAVVIQVEAASLAQQGQAFYQTSEGVWLTEAIPPSHLSLVE